FPSRSVNNHLDPSPDAGCTLPPAEEAVVRQPFAPRAARVRLAKSVEKATSEAAAEVRQGVGWAQPERGEWRGRPPAARQIPQDWSDLPVVRFTNTEIGGTREIRLHRGLEYDQWLLHDRLHEITACISVQRATRRVYFMEIARRRDRRWT